MTTFPEDEAPAMMSYAGRLVPINSEGMREVIDEATRLRAEVKHQREYVPVGQDGVPITQAQYDTVRAEVAELRQDRERLDWIAACVKQKAASADAWVWSSLGGPASTPVIYDLRAAIDAARDSAWNSHQEAVNRATDYKPYPEKP